MYKKNRLAFYEVSERYIEYLKRYDDKVPNIRYETREKFVCGILFNVNGNGYYAPISSFNKPQRTNHIIKVGEYPVGSIRFSFMFPVPDSEIRRKDFSKEDQHYKNLINSEYRYCKIHQAAILKKAKEVYDRTLNDVPTYAMNCCDFKLLESKCKEWEKLHENEILGYPLEEAREVDVVNKPKNIHEDCKSVGKEIKKARIQKQAGQKEIRKLEKQIVKDTVKDR